MTRALFVVGPACLLACSSSGTPADPPAPPVAAKPRWIECTEAARAPMEKLLVGRYHLDAGTLTCVTIELAHEPAFFVELVGTTGDTHHRLHGVIATDGTTEKIALRDVPLDWARLHGGKVWFETVDLDGDRADELIVHRGDDRHPGAEWIDVIAIRDRALVELPGPHIAYDDPDLEENCRGTLATERAGSAMHLVAQITTSTGPSEHCLAAGRHVYAFAEDRLEELR